MSLTKRIGFGWTLAAAGGGLANIVDGFKGPGAKATMADTSVLTDFWDTFAKCCADGGEMTFTVAYDPIDANSLSIGDMLQNTTATTFTVTDNSGHAQTFSAFVTGIDREVKKKNLVTADITLKITGDPGYSHN